MNNMGGSLDAEISEGGSSKFKPSPPPYFFFFFNGSFLMVLTQIF